MTIKICGITNLEDALAAIDSGASALGFNFYPKSPRYIDPARAAEIIARLPESVDTAGVFVNGAAAEIALQAGLDIVQLHGDEPPSAVPAKLRSWKAFRVSPEFSMDQLASYSCEAFLLDAPTAGYGGSGEIFDWRRARSSEYRIILAGGLDASNVQQAIEQANPWGVDACSRLEIEPGRKDHRKVEQFIKAARS